MREACRNCGAYLEADFMACPECEVPVAPPQRTELPWRGGPSSSPRGVNGQGPRKLAYLVVKNGTNAGESFRLADSTGIGSDPENRIVLPDRYVSRRHGQVVFQSGVFVYHDLAALNGSWFVSATGEKRRISSPLRLMHGDTIEIGRTRVTFVEAGK